MMMIALKGLIFFVPVLLIGCAGTACSRPGELSGTLQRCFYVLQVIKVDPTKKEVTAITHPKRVTENKENDHSDYYGGPQGEQFTFKVPDFDSLTALGGQLQAQPVGTPNPKVYMFTSISDSVTLELLPETTVTKLLDGKRIQNFKY
jgi:hypothetical protein